MSTISNRLKDLIIQQKLQSFTDPSKATDLEALGIMISQYCEWSGVDILQVTYFALEDSNFHTENEIINQLIESLK